MALTLSIQRLYLHKEVELCLQREIGASSWARRARSGTAERWGGTRCLQLFNVIWASPAAH
jgi:hypothetical protein